MNTNCGMKKGESEIGEEGSSRSTRREREKIFFSSCGHDGTRKTYFFLKNNFPGAPWGSRWWLSPQGLKPQTHTRQKEGGRTPFFFLQRVLLENCEYIYVFVDIAWKMFQQESPTQVEKLLSVSSAAELYGLLAAFDHLPAQIRWAIDDATGTQSWHLGRPNGQRTTAGIAVLIFATVRWWMRHRQSCMRMATRRHGANNRHWENRG